MSNAAPACSHWTFGEIHHLAPYPWPAVGTLPGPPSAERQEHA